MLEIGKNTMFKPSKNLPNTLGFSRTIDNFFILPIRHHLDLISLEWLPCETCSLFFPSQAVLHNHVSVSHNATPPAGPSRRFKCDFCPQTFVDSTRYYNHANQVTLNETLTTIFNRNPRSRITIRTGPVY